MEQETRLPFGAGLQLEYAFLPEQNLTFKIALISGDFRHLSSSAILSVIPPLRKHQINFADYSFVKLLLANPSQVP